ncbi:MAG: hypothetical protein FWF00_00130 [Endomicrobia bacterium]|nr:hypothetical protein [Endomicrobiia bacterium]MCL2506085.1 hypothetical protein [Endomicrobiia bacterium]
MRCFSKILKYMMSADRKNEKIKISTFKKPLTIFRKSLEFTGILSKNNNAPQNIDMTKISNLNPAKKDHRIVHADNSLKNEPAEIKRANLAIAKMAKNIKRYMPVSFNLNNLFSLFNIKLIYYL